MKNFQKLMGGAVLALMLTTVACSDTAPATGTPGDIGDTSKEADLQKEIDDLKQQIEDLKNGKPADAAATLADIVGHWTATSDVVIDDNGNLVDFIVKQNYDLVIGGDGSYSFTISDKKAQKLDAFADVLSVTGGHTLVMDGSPAYTVSLPTSGTMKWVSLPGKDNSRTVEWKKAAPKLNLPPLDPTI